MNTGRAVLRLMAAATTAQPGPDRRTTIADCRAALCIAQGVALDDIDPADGYDISERAYQSARESWRAHVRQWGFSEQYDRPHYERAVAGWRRRRPDLAKGDDWLAGLDIRAGGRP